MSTPTTYSAAFHHHDDGSWEVIFLDMPLTFSAGDTFPQARTNAIEALGLAVAGYLEAGEALPKRRNLDDLMSDPHLAEDVAGATILEIEAPRPNGRAEKITITVDEFLLARIRAEARSRSMSQSGFFAEAARRLIQQG
jgi:predicted RNase H-like HicB family nuclease